MVPPGSQPAGSPYGPLDPGGAGPYGQPSSGGPYGQPSSGGPYGQPSSGGPYGQPPGYPPAGPPPTQQFGQPGAQPYGVLPPIPPPPKRRTGLIIGIVVGALVLVLLLCGVGGVFLLRSGSKPGPVAQSSSRPTASASASESPGESASPSASPSQRVDITSRQTDPKPLTTAEVFPAPTIPAVDAAPYTIIKRDILTRCSGGAFGKVASLLTQGGCTQIVRATLLDSSKRYVATTGVANMPDEASAAKVQAVLRTSSNRATGFFSPLAAPGAGGYSDQQALVFISQVVGHYIVYYIAGKANGEDLSTSDPQTKNFTISLLPYHQQLLVAREG
jgi:hypothetical protein